MKVQHHVKKEVENFFNFLNEQQFKNVALGVIMGGAFANMVKSFVDNIIWPFIDIFGTKTMNQRFIVLKNGNKTPYKTINDAKNDNATVITYGDFVQSIIVFSTQIICIYIFLRILSKMEQIPSKITSK